MPVAKETQRLSTKWDSGQIKYKTCCMPLPSVMSSPWWKYSLSGRCPGWELPLQTVEQTQGTREAETETCPEPRSGSQMRADRSQDEVWNVLMQSGKSHRASTTATQRHTPTAPHPGAGVRHGQAQQSPASPANMQSVIRIDKCRVDCGVLGWFAYSFVIKK